MPINNANKDGAWEHWWRSASKGLWECWKGKLISTETRRAFLAKEGINMTHCFILTTSELKTSDYSAGI